MLYNRDFFPVDISGGKTVSFLLSSLALGDSVIAYLPHDLRKPPRIDAVILALANLDSERHRRDYILIGDGVTKFDVEGNESAYKRDSVPDYSRAAVIHLGR